MLANVLKKKNRLFFELWYADAARLPILVKGARQIGKTEAIRHFASSHYDSIVEIYGFADNKLTVPWFCAFLLDRYLGVDSKTADATVWFDPGQRQ